MKRFLLPLLATLVFTLSVQAQNLTLSEETDLHERPNVASSVKMTLPSGIQLSILSEQEGWLAVTTSTGVVGWVEKVTEADEEDTSDLIRSISNLNQEAGQQENDEIPPPTQDTQAPPPTRQTQSSTTQAPPSQQAPPAETPSTPSQSPPPPPPATPAQQEPPPPPATSVTNQPPPPPPATPPGRDVSFGETASTGQPAFTSIVSGIYNKSQWISAALDLKDEYKKLDLQFNKILGDIFQLGGWITGTEGFVFPDINVDDFSDFGGFGFSPAGKGLSAESSCCNDPIKSAVGGFRGGVIVPQLFEKVGGHASIVLGGGTFFDTPEHVDNVNQALAGLEGGLFYKFGNPTGAQFIPRAAVQINRTEFLCGDEATFCGFDENGDSESRVGDTATTVLLGLEMQYKGLVPGLHLTLIETPEEGKTFESIFGFSLTLAYGS